MTQCDKFRRYKKIYDPAFATIYTDGNTEDKAGTLADSVISERLAILRRNVAALDDLIWTKSKFGVLSKSEQEEALKGYVIVKEVLANYENAKFKHLRISG